MKKVYIDWIDLFVTLVSTVTLFSTADLVGRLEVVSVAAVYFFSLLVMNWNISKTKKLNMDIRREKHHLTNLKNKGHDVNLDKLRRMKKYALPVDDSVFSAIKFVIGLVFTILMAIIQLIIKLPALNVIARGFFTDLYLMPLALIFINIAKCLLLEKRQRTQIGSKRESIKTIFKICVGMCLILIAIASTICEYADSNLYIGIIIVLYSIMMALK